MKTTLATISLSLLLPILAEAKITVFSNSDSLRKLVVSQEFKNLERAHGKVTNISVEERFDSSAMQAFELVITLAGKQTPHEVCTAVADIMVVRDEDAPRGITTSKMLDPVVSQTVCAP